MKQIIADAFSALFEIENVGSTNAKKSILEQNKDNEVLKAICFATYGGDKYHCHQFDIDAGFRDEPQLYEQNWNDFLALLDTLKTRSQTGNAAVAAMNAFMYKVGPVEHKWYKRVLSHDLNVGVSLKTLGKVWDFKGYHLGTKKEDCSVSFPGVMLCGTNLKKLLKTAPTVAVSAKLDGYRLLLVIKGRYYSFFSRQGKSDFYNENLRHIAEAFMAAGYVDVAIDGEIMHTDWNRTGVVKTKNPSAEEKQDILDNVKFHCFDTFDSEQGKTWTFRDRWQRLESMVKEVNNKSVVLVEQVILTHPTEYEIEKLHEHFVNEGYEGVIVKDFHSVYEHGKRSDKWIKVKIFHTIDCRITDMVEGKSDTKYKGMLGALTVQNEQGAVFNVGSGFTDEQRIDYWNNKSNLIGKWIEVKYQKDTTGVCRFPTFVRWRVDIND